MQLFKHEICTRQLWSSFPPNAIVDETGDFRGEFTASTVWPAVSSAYGFLVYFHRTPGRQALTVMLYAGLIQKKHRLGVSAALESGIKREDGIQDIKPSITPPPSFPPPGSSLAVEDEMGNVGGTTGRPAPHEPTPAPLQVLYDPTLYPLIEPVVPKRGRARALDFEPIDDPPTKKRRVNPPPKSISTSTPPPPPPQPKKTTLFTANKSGPITRTRDGKFLPVPIPPKRPKWGLSPAERVGLGPEPLIVVEVGGESPPGDGGSSVSTLNSSSYLDTNTPRNQVRRCLPELQFAI